MTIYLRVFSIVQISFIVLITSNNYFLSTPPRQFPKISMEPLIPESDLQRNENGAFNQRQVWKDIKRDAKAQASKASKFTVSGFIHEHTTRGQLFGARIFINPITSIFVKYNNLQADARVHDENSTWQYMFEACYLEDSLFPFPPIIYRVFSISRANTLRRRKKIQPKRMILRFRENRGSSWENKQIVWTVGRRQRDKWRSLAVSIH